MVRIVDIFGYKHGNKEPWTEKASNTSKEEVYYWKGLVVASISDGMSVTDAIRISFE